MAGENWKKKEEERWARERRGSFEFDGGARGSIVKVDSPSSEPRAELILSPRGKNRPGSLHGCENPGEVGPFRRETVVPVNPRSDYPLENNRPVLFKRGRRNELEAKNSRESGRRKRGL